MPPCYRCGVDIRWAEVATEEAPGITQVQRVALDNLPKMRGADRFREVGYNPLRVEPVPADADVVAYARHDCEGVMAREAL